MPNKSIQIIRYRSNLMLSVLQPHQYLIVIFEPRLPQHVQNRLPAVLGHVAAAPVLGEGYVDEHIRVVAGLSSRMPGSQPVARALVQPSYECGVPIQRGGVDYRALADLRPALDFNLLLWLLRAARALRFRVACALACTSALAKPLATRAAPPTLPAQAAHTSGLPHFWQRINRASR